MRIWSISPHYLDAKGLVALWREALLAQSVLTGNSTGYKNHPQLDRFNNTRNPVGAIASYLRYIAKEADRRSYHFDKTKIINKRLQGKVNVASGQVEYEFSHLLKKLKHRDPQRYKYLLGIKKVDIHPLFEKVPGDIENWEII